MSMLRDNAWTDGQLTYLTKNDFYNFYDCKTGPMR